MQDDVIAALDHAQIAEGPGGPAAMVPGQHHVRMNMYIAQARSGRFEIVERLGAIDPQERHVATPVVDRLRRTPRLTTRDTHHEKETNDAARDDTGRGLRPLHGDLLDRRARRSASSTARRARSIFRDPAEDDRVWVIFDWDEQGWQSFVSDPEVPPIMKEAGHKSRPVAAPFAAHCGA